MQKQKTTATIVDMRKCINKSAVIEIEKQQNQIRNKRMKIEMQ